MAWNDVYSNDNGVHLLVSIGGRSYNFNKAVDIKVERKIGDTLNKFSLGIIDDGTTTFQEFEQVVTNKFVNIDVAYGNSSKTISKFTGFVIDYQPVFFGTSSKLTVSGYVSRTHSGTPKLTSLYNYWINWSPLIGKRLRTNEPWALIYESTFKFNSDMVDTGESKIGDVSNWLGSEDKAASLIEGVLADRKAEVDRLEQIYLDTKKKDNSSDGSAVPHKNGASYRKAKEEGAQVIYKDGSSRIYWGYIEYKKYTDAMQPDLPQLNNTFTNPVHKEPYNSKIKSVYKVNIGDTYLVYRNGDMALESHVTTLSKGSGTASDNAYKNYQAALQSYKSLKSQFENIFKKDTIGSMNGVLWDYGHVPWRYEILSKYKGNVKIQKFERPGGSIARIVPDIFVKWDHMLPCDPAYMEDKDAEYKSKNASALEKAANFPKGAVNDITMYGLKYTFDEKTYKENQNNPLSAYTLSADDMHGNIRVFEAGGEDYIWVGDTPELYKLWEKNDWNYNAKYDSKGDSRKSEAAKNSGYAEKEYKKDTPYSKDDVLFLCEKVTKNDNHITMTDSELKEFKELNNKLTDKADKLYRLTRDNRASFHEQSKASPSVNYSTYKSDRREEDKNFKNMQNFIKKLVNKYLKSSDAYSLYINGNPANAECISVSWGFDHFIEKGNTFPGQARESDNYLGVRYSYKKITKRGRAAKAFTSSDDKNTKDGWKQDCNDGNIEEGNKEVNPTSKYGIDYRLYEMTDLKEDKKLGIKKMSKKERVTKYFTAAYRSGEVMGYGHTYISDIVAQLCELEGWKNPSIAATVASEYKEAYLDMGGMSALEYISTVLCEHAVEAGGLGRSGFTCYFDKNGRFHFEPVDALKDTHMTSLQFGYNMNNSNVLSFTVRSKGQELMLGLNTDVSSYNMYTGEQISATASRQESTMSSTEQKLYQQVYGSIENNGQDTLKTVWFNLPLFNYYGYQQDVNDYSTFTKTVANGGEISWGTNLVKRNYKSSLSGSTGAYLKALNDLDELRKTAIKAEMTIVGDNTITPGTYINIMNYTRMGMHYTSGLYFIQSITDTVTTGNGFTQSLNLLRFSEDIINMTTELKPKMIANSAYGTQLENAISKFQSDPNGFQKYYDDNFK